MGTQEAASTGLEALGPLATPPDDKSSDMNLQMQIPSGQGPRYGDTVPSSP